jgi:hypothetical protein
MAGSWNFAAHFFAQRMQNCGYWMNVLIVLHMAIELLLCRLGLNKHWLNETSFRGQIVWPIRRFGAPSQLNALRCFPR